MIIKPSIRSNIFTNAHPFGCKAFVEHQIKEAKALEPFNGPKNVLIIGGSSGYGLSTRIALAVGANANTINVSFESAPKGKRTGTAGWWNNIYFQELTREFGSKHKDFVGDAFSSEMKQQVIDYVKNEFGKLDLIIYSLAAGARRDETTNEIVRSHIKTLGEAAIGKTIDVASHEIKDLTVTEANEQEVKETVFVMGGSDWHNWIQRFDAENLLNEGVKTISYTYIGGPTTETIYRGGTLGKAKEDLEEKARLMDGLFKEKYNGEALISSSKAVVTKASVFIPQMPIYVSCLYDVMMRHSIHESILEHKYRLFKDMIYGNNRITDDKNRIRLDHLEMQEFVQSETVELMKKLSNEALFELEGTKEFFNEFYKIHGFGFDSIDYKKDVDLDKLSELEPK
ncbi:enoyl-ACP reductase FabV [Liberiplasma polymorphum]|jgi:enoyl-[acyl-carrier protein] reductase / trans-2-enoyl-CoA reductase (NAD+)|uniref:enoyl-ACP reductase FabV n=1 Tax=Liberiplasma polymorphum TaxID=3374570 RepID=UPI0037764EB0